MIPHLIAAYFAGLLLMPYLLARYFGQARKADFPLSVLWPLTGIAFAMFVLGKLGEKHSHRRAPTVQEIGK